MEDILKKLEVLEKESYNPKFKKNIQLLLSHLKLLYKYAGNGERVFREKNLLRNNRVMSQLKISVALLNSNLKPYHSIIGDEYRSMMAHSLVDGSDIEKFLEHGLDLIEITLTGEQDIQEGNVFLGIEEKLERANKSARGGNQEGLFSNLHTIVELLLKDKLGIALDMDGARLGKVLKICIENEVFIGKNSILKQLNTNVCDIDNKMKHSGYSPTAKQMNDALLVTTQAVRVLKKDIPKIDGEISEEISKILIKNN